VEPPVEERERSQSLPTIDWRSETDPSISMSHPQDDSEAANVTYTPLLTSPHVSCDPLSVLVLRDRKHMR
jgi:hypothetical protein